MILGSKPEEKEMLEDLEKNRGQRQGRIYESVMLDVIEEAKRCLEKGMVEEGFTRIEIKGTSAK